MKIKMNWKLKKPTNTVISAIIRISYVLNLSKCFEHIIVNFFLAHQYEHVF